MTALIVYESMYGNTQRVAEAVAEGLGRYLPTRAVEVAEAPTMVPSDVDLVVVGGPTHAHGMSTEKTRADAGTRRAEPLISRGGIRDWLATAYPAKLNLPAAAFDTRARGLELLTGSAAKGFAKLLAEAGFKVIEPAESFIIAARGAVEPDALAEGELDRARAWGEKIGGHLARR